jgi:hypothetical protein
MRSRNANIAGDEGAPDRVDGRRVSSAAGTSGVPDFPRLLANFIRPRFSAGKPQYR